MGGCGASSGSDDTTKNPAKSRSNSKAAALPTIDPATSKRIKTNRKVVVRAIESCAVSNIDGTYTGCSTAAGLASVEPSLSKTDIITSAPRINQLQIVLTPDKFGFLAQLVLAAKDGTKIYVAELHASDGSIGKYCGETPITIDTPVAGMKCPIKSLS